MALFVSDLAIADQRLLGEAKLAILFASTLCALAGFGLLRRALPNPVHK
jgi:Na+/H+ antiporter NhaA